MTEKKCQDHEQSNRPDDRRAAPRFDCALRTELRLGDNLIPGSVSNLSVVGARVDVATQLEEDAELEMRLYLSMDESDDEDVAVVAGSVVWTLAVEGDGFMSGLRFEIMGPHELERLRRFLRSLAPPG